jgi:fatty acid desaturase
MPDARRRSAGDFAELSQLIRQAGLLDRRPGRYAVRGGLILAALGGAWIAFVHLGDTWWQLVTAVFLAAVWAQVSFIGHDAGHKQILRGRRANDAVGLVHAGLIGLSYGWWVAKHSRHHANPNHEHDPDLDIAILASTAGQGRAERGFSRWTVKYQYTRPGCCVPTATCSDTCTRSVRRCALRRGEAMSQAPATRRVRNRTCP